ncbi:tripartite tricarboxylate transporter TctB family protein [Oceanicella sp. SM1341]|uniref:tripartite tricarboxylate transporter TctB family protein n=1 Tax=Oceanicella sp. SM1341 TaxID=1548889 RepID=UPI000E4BF042|nr:tripartite tricarboxylate transporter TctB family protein [Oceanicella sp. SM1341]
MPRQSFNRAEVFAAAGLAAFGLAVIALATDYPLGGLRRPGPGFFPILTGTVLVALALGVLAEVRGLATRPVFRLRPFLAVSLGIAGFALTVERAGLVPATIILVLVSGLGEERTSLLSLAGVALFLSVLGVLLFIEGLGMPLSAIRGVL